MRAPALLLAVLTVLPVPLAAQSIAVVANPALRPTAVLRPHVRYVVAADSIDGVAVIRDLSVPPVTFTGSIRIEGVQPGARAPGRHAFADTVRFDADGRVVFLLADEVGRPPMSVEVLGARTAPAGRINIVATRWPLGRVMLATITPADLYELAFRATGYGVRDRIRTDDRSGFAFLTDSGAGATTVAIGFGRGSRGRFQADLASIVLFRDFGGQTGQERRELGALSLVIDPARDDDGTARAEIIFGVGNSEEDAMRAARAASDEAPQAPRAASVRWDTPSGDADLLLRHLTAAAGWMLDWDVLDGQRTIPSSAARPVVRAHDAWRGATLALQRGDTAAVCGSYRLLRPAAAGAPVHTQVALRLGARGRTLTVSDSADAEADAAFVLLAYTCYRATRDASMLNADYPALAALAGRAAGAAGALGPRALERLAEMDEERSRLSGVVRESGGDSLRAEAARLTGQTPAPQPGVRWRALAADAQRGIGREYGRLSAREEIGGLSFAAAGDFLSGMAGEVFGVREFLDRLEIAPQLGGVADDHTWLLEGWVLSGDTLNFSYKPADRSAVIRLTASRRQRLVLRFPWLTATSCVAVRRGPDAERLSLVALADGSFYVDLRAFYDPAVITLSAGACAGR